MLLPRISCNSNKYTGKPSHKSAHEFDSVQHLTRIYLRSKIAHLLHKQVLQSQNLNTAAILLSRPSPSFYRTAAHSHLDPVEKLRLEQVTQPSGGASNLAGESTVQWQL